MDFRNPRYTNAASDHIDLEIDHPSYGWLPCTINAEEYPDLWPAVVATEVSPFVPPDAEAHRAAWRAGASLSRSQFCIALKRVRILSQAEAVEAAKGGWPASFDPFLTDLPPEAGIDPEEAVILWGAVTIIERMHPLFELVRQFHGMPPHEADALFGYEAPEWTMPG